MLIGSFHGQLSDEISSLRVSLIEDNSKFNEMVKWSKLESGPRLFYYFLFTFLNCLELLLLMTTRNFLLLLY